MDITITEAELVEGRYLRLVSVAIDAGKERVALMQMPKETLAIRAAEYDVEVDDPFALELVMREHLIRSDDFVAPLYTDLSAQELRAEMDRRLEAVRVEHGAPAGADRLIARAVELDKASDGMVEAHRLFLTHADPDIREVVQEYRDRERARLKKSGARPSLVDQLKSQL